MYTCKHLLKVILQERVHFQQLGHVLSYDFMISFWITIISQIAVTSSDACFFHRYREGHKSQAEIKEEIADKIDGLDWNKFVGNADFYPFKVVSIWIYIITCTFKQNILIVVVEYTNVHVGW